MQKPAQHVRVPVRHGQLRSVHIQLGQGLLVRWVDRRIADRKGFESLGVVQLAAVDEEHTALVVAGMVAEDLDNKDSAAAAGTMVAGLVMMRTRSADHMVTAGTEQHADRIHKATAPMHIEEGEDDMALVEVPKPERAVVVVSAVECDMVEGGVCAQDLVYCSR